MFASWMNDLKITHLDCNAISDKKEKLQGIDYKYLQERTVLFTFMK